MLKTPSSTRSESRMNPLKVFKKGGKDEQLAKTAPNTPEEEIGVTVISNEIDPTRAIVRTSTLEHVSPLRDNHRSPSLGDHRSASGMVREEKKEDPSVPGDNKSTDGDVVSKTLNFFDDFCHLPQVAQITADSGVQALAESTIKSHPYLLRHHQAAFGDDQTSSPSLPSETTGSVDRFSSVDVTSSHMKSVQSKKINPAAGAHNHENFEVVLDPASMIKEEEQTPITKPRGTNRWKKYLVKEKNGGPNNDDSLGADKPQARDAADAPVNDEIGLLLGANQSSDQYEGDAAEENEKASAGVGGPKAGAKKIWKNLKKTIKGDQKADSEEPAVPAKSLEEQDVLQSESPQEDAEPVKEEDEAKGTVEPKPETTEEPASALDTLDNMCGLVDAEASVEETETETKPNPEEEKQLRMLEAMVPMRQSVEVVNKKSGHKRTSSLGMRLKKIQNSSYFKKGSKAAKAPVKPKGSSQPAADAISVDLSVDANGNPKKPKRVWRAVEDPNTGRMYYYHRKTRETTWVKPEALTLYEAAYKKWLDAIGPADTQAPTVEATKDVEAKTPATSTESAFVSKAADENVNVAAPEEDKNTKSALPTKKEEAAEKEAGRATKTQPLDDDSEPFDEEKPFDEPMGDKKGPGLLFLPRSPPRFGRATTITSKASARSALTDRTEKVKNTGRGRFSAFSPISENKPTSTGISSFNDTRDRVPSRVPVIRERQLMVEELTDARLNAESYEGKSGERRGRIVKGRARAVEPTPESLYDGDNDTDYGTSHYDNDTYGTDSVSALSDNDTDFLSRKDNFDQARRRALDAAIETEDWDLAAALSDGMNAVNLPGGYEKAHKSWNQTELDKFIANNDWNAVKSYIAKMRSQSKKEQAKTSSGGLPSIPANKRLGSRSQIQHTRDAGSESSWSGSDSQSSYDDETYDSESM